MTSLSASVSLPRTLTDARQAIDEHEGQVSSVVGELILNNSLTQLVESASQLHQHLDVRFVIILSSYLCAPA